MQLNGAGRVADTVRATEGVPPAVEEALAAVVAVVVTRYASLSSCLTHRLYQDLPCPSHL